jgi:drug/metabolite transporter (DMT)-like permease
VLFTVLSVLASSAGSMIAMRTQRRGYATWPSMAWGMLYGGVLAFICALLLGRSVTIGSGWAYYGTLVYLALFGSIVTFACYLTILRRLGAAQAGYVGVMTPVVALLISMLFEAYLWTWMTTLGVALSLIGNLLMLRPPTAPGRGAV